MTDADLRHASGPALARALAAGRRIDPESLAGWTFHGTSLGLPSWLERLTWKTFAKAFVRDPDGTVRGWNVRCQQADPPRWRPRTRRGVPVTFGHFTVVDEADGLVLDYGRGGDRDRGRRRAAAAGGGGEDEGEERGRDAEQVLHGGLRPCGTAPR